MAIDIGELRGILTLQDQFSGPVNNAAKQLGFFGESFGAITKFAGLAAGAVAAATGVVIALGSRGAAVDDVRAAFGRLSAAAGESADVMLGALSRGVKGTVSDFELMSLANKALGAGLVRSSADMETLSAGARALAKRVGGDTKQAFDTLLTSIASGRTAQLKQLGLFVDSKAATEAFAKSLGKSTGDLTDAERAQALSAEALAKLREELERNVPDAADFGEMIEQGKVRLRNFIDSLSVAVATSPVVRAGMRAMGEALDAAFGTDQQTTVKKLMGFINDFAIGLTYVAQGGAVAATVLVTAWYGVKTAILAVLTAVGGVGTALVGFVAGVAEMGSKIPVVGKHVEGFADGAKALAQGLAAATGSLAEQTAEAAKGVMGQSALQQAIDKVHGAILNVRTAMIAAKDAQVETNAGIQAFGAATTEVAGRTEENARKILEAHQKLEEELALIGRVGIDRRLMELEFARQRELKGLQDLKQVTVAEYEGMAAMVNEKYAEMAEAAKRGDDEILEAERKLHEELAIARTTGLEEQLLQIEFARERELEGLVHLKDRYGEEYADLVALVNEKYNQMAEAAQGHGLTVEQLAAEAGFKTRDELERTAAKAIETYERMKASGQFNANQLKEAYLQAEVAKRLAAGETATYQMTSGQAWLAGTEQLFGVLGEKHKAAAIAGAIIATYAAIAKALASAPWPANLLLAAGAAAAGWANVNKIRSSDPGYAVGTPGTHFVDFGRGSLEMLHGEEAVVTKAQGESLAAMLREAIEGAGAAGAPGGRLGGTTIINDIKIDENPFQTSEDRRAHRDFTLKAIDDRTRRNLPLLVATGLA